MEQTIPILDLAAQYERIRRDVEPVVLRVLESGRYIGGEECRSFEQEFASYCGVTHACGVANGTDALTVCLRSTARVRYLWTLSPSLARWTRHSWRAPSHRGPS